MAVKIMDAGSVLREASSLKVQDGGTLRRILRVKVMDATSTLRTVATFVPPLSATATVTSEESPIGLGGNLYQIVCTTYATPGGGLGPYTYAWELLSGGDVWSAYSLTSANAQFSTRSEIYAPAVAQVTVTDATGQTATATASF